MSVDLDDHLDYDVGRDHRVFSLCICKYNIRLFAYFNVRRNFAIKSVSIAGPGAFVVGRSPKRLSISI